MAGDGGASSGIQKADSGDRPDPRGLILAVAANICWGTFPILFHQLGHVPALEVMAHRIVWSLLFAGGILALMKERRGLVACFNHPVRLKYTLASAATIGLNWLVFIHAVETGRILQASMGYFLLPLVLILLGVVVLRERLSRRQILALGLASVAVVIMVLRLGELPWIALVLGVSFSFYSLFRKMAQTDPITAVAAETLLLLPPALMYLLWVEGSGAGGFLAGDLTTRFFLFLTGPTTVLVLVLYIGGARRLPMSVLGFIQYLTPSLQFLIAVLLYQEPFTWVHGMVFGLIWTGIVVSARGRRRQAA